MAHKLRMLESTVVEVAQRYWNLQAEIRVQKHGRPSLLQGLKVMNVRSGYKMPNQWIVLFSSRMVDGGVIDSPPAVIVNDDTEEARFEDF